MWCESSKKHASRAEIKRATEEGDKGMGMAVRGVGSLDHEAWFHGTVVGWVSCHRMPELVCFMYHVWRVTEFQGRVALERERKLGKAFPQTATKNTWFESRCHFRNTRCSVVSCIFIVRKNSLVTKAEMTFVNILYRNLVNH